MSVVDALQRELKKAAFKRVPSKKHIKYRDDLGRLFVTAATPSDRLAAENAFADFRKLVTTATKYVDPRPLRARRTKTRLEPLPVEPVAVVPASPTKEELKCAAKEARLLARWEDEEKQRKEARELLRYFYKDVLYLAHILFWEDWEKHGHKPEHYTHDLGLAAGDLYCALKNDGFNPKVMLGELDGGKGGFLCVLCSGFFLDITENVVRDTPTWKEHGINFEVFWELPTVYDKKTQRFRIYQEAAHLEKDKERFTESLRREAKAGM
jgi:hypothetical protein